MYLLQAFYAAINSDLGNCLRRMGNRSTALGLVLTFFKKFIYLAVSVSVASCGIFHCGMPASLVVVPGLS